ncbi:hypothetical protein RXV86_13810 [Alisedimentitalea sp. MJ-SS2]|uniref:hypothetical protein n=1 Tax=Aliisedimentitalea sp. MJ-SS2 TaxID=3049795 RepID=UPI002913D7BC|nr:hypothetical protein [Alisedimentitalea sp. MJ-SS2]MDU8928461.1 hypothetical protein [Alisedimentitalea sp. MJ-SS2]
MREQDIIQSVAPFFEEIERLGYEVEATSDFEKIMRLVPQTGRKKATPMMSIQRNDFTEETAFWLFLFKDGQVVGGIGAKYEPLGRESFASYLCRTSRTQYDRDDNPIAEVAEPATEMIGGNIVYIGELEFAREHRGNLKLLEAFMRVHQGLCAVKWRNLDWIYAIVPEEHQRFSWLYGFMVSIPGVLRWREPVPDGRLNSHVLLATDGRYLRYVLVNACRRLKEKRLKAAARKQG